MRPYSRAANPTTKPRIAPSTDPVRRSAAPARSVVLGALLIGSAAVSAQTYTDGAAQWNASFCISCHAGGTVPLTTMQAGRYASTQAALNAINNAIQNQQGAMTQFSSLSTAQRTNLAYFISNWRAEGNVSANPGPSLTVSAVGQTASTVITLFNNGRAPMTVATNNGVRLSGANANQFTVAGVGSGCMAMTLAANGGSCQVRVTYQPSAAPSPTHNVTLTFEHNGEPNATTSLALTGSFSASPPPAPAPSGSGGGGALASVLGALLLPAALLRRARRRASA